MGVRVCPFHLTYQCSDPRFERLKTIALKQKKDLVSKNAKISSVLPCTLALTVTTTHTHVATATPHHLRTQRVRELDHNAQGEAEREAGGPERETHGAGALTPSSVLLA